MSLLRPHMLDLPDELLILILDHISVSNEDLITLSLVSRRLHNLALSICFTRLGIRKPAKQVKIYMTDKARVVDGLTVIRLSLNISSLDRLSIKFPACNNLRTLIRCINRATACIQSLKSVERVVFVFSDSHCCCCNREGDDREKKLEPGLLQDWSSAMGGLMNTVIEKGCRKLLVKGGRYLGHVYAFRRNRASQSNHKLANPIEAVKSFFTGSRSGDAMDSVKSLFSNSRPASSSNLRGGKGRDDSDDGRPPPQVRKGDDWEFKRARHNAPMVLADVTLAARKNTKLSTLNIQSMMFLMPPLLQWTISIMQYSPLEALNLEHLSVNFKCWPALFELLGGASGSHLTTLKIRNSRHINPVDLLPFVGCFPQLETLDINHDVDSVDCYNLSPFPDFPRLTSLRAPAPWIFKLLSAHQHGLERLESLTIIYKLRNEGLVHWFKPCHPSIPSLLGEHSRPVTLTLEVRMGENPAWQLFEHLNGEAVSSSNQPDAVDLVSSITILVQEEFIKADIPLPTVLSKWLGMFPALRLLSVLGRNEATDGMDLFKELVSLVKAKKLLIDVLNVNGRIAEFTHARDQASLSLLETPTGEEPKGKRELRNEEDEDDEDDAT
ncbi:hypothetical protein BKA70DRAFT_1269548 [Coprinopsis sp. MPI-PUGE-AT-0042]|nr:hypothetical protein BKA70DRAFT_1269548 [Coprinopsis sp. MPI-PUGE-AT-0042]